MEETTRKLFMDPTKAYLVRKICPSQRHQLLKYPTFLSPVFLAPDCFAFLWESKPGVRNATCVPSLELASASEKPVLLHSMAPVPHCRSAPLPYTVACSGLSLRARAFTQGRVEHVERRSASPTRFSGYQEWSTSLGKHQNPVQSSRSLGF